MSVTVTEEDYQIGQKICEGIERSRTAIVRMHRQSNSLFGIWKRIYQMYLCAMDANSLEEASGTAS